MNAVCVKRNFEYECWFLGDYSDQCEDVWMMGRVFFLIGPNFCYAALCNAGCHKNAKMTVFSNGNISELHSADLDRISIGKKLYSDCRNFLELLSHDRYLSLPFSFIIR
jgi:hypothetical protein